jgi:hypothetical protein
LIEITFNNCWVIQEVKKSKKAVGRSKKLKSQEELMEVVEPRGK